MNDGAQAVMANGNSDDFLRSRFSSLLATKDRDFLLSPTGAQVLSLELFVTFSL